MNETPNMPPCERDISPVASVSEDFDAPMELIDSEELARLRYQAGLAETQVKVLKCHVEVLTKINNLQSFALEAATAKISVINYENRKFIRRGSSSGVSEEVFDEWQAQDAKDIAGARKIDGIIAEFKALIETEVGG